jgi:citrate lyase subunit beta / citryl-CoA lyase
VQLPNLHHQLHVEEVGLSEIDRECVSPQIASPNRKRTWLFGPGADHEQHRQMAASTADVLILDLEDFTPPALKAEARKICAPLLNRWRTIGLGTAVRINALDGDGLLDLEAAMPGRPDFVLYPMASNAAEMEALDHAISAAEIRHGAVPGSVAIVPVCETALGVADVRIIAQGSRRIGHALLGAEDLAADLLADRSRQGDELEYARRRFLLECRAAGIEPIDAPYTFSDIEGLQQEASRSRSWGYKAKSLVRPEHAAPLKGSLVPSAEEFDRARTVVREFEAARELGKDRVLVEGLWIEVPTYRSALRTLRELD